MENKKVAGLTEMREKILEFVKLQGPVLPVKLSKAINSDITLAGAILSELVAGKKLKVSFAKIGGSPVYYTPGQESKLQTLEPYLHGREKDAYKLLKEKRVIWEGDAEPWQRVAMKDLKDFALPINVIAADGTTMNFWRWYMASEDEIKPVVARFLEPPKPVVQQQIEQKQIQPEKQEIKITKQEVLQDFIGSTEVDAKKIERLPKRAKVEKTINVEDLDNYLAKRRIEILSKEVDKRGKEIDIVAYVPSGLGKVKFFIAYRAKRRITETDIGMVFGKAQSRNIPAILLSNGELTKKAKLYLEKDFRSVNFHKI